MIGTFDYEALLDTLRNSIESLVPQATNEDLAIRTIKDIQEDRTKRAAEEALERRRNAACRAGHTAPDDSAADAEAAEADAAAARIQQQAEVVMAEDSSTMHVEEPPVLEAAISWPQALPDLRLDDVLGVDAQRVAAKAAQLAGLPGLRPDQAAEQCVLLGLLPHECPGAEAAHALFDAACFAPDPWLAAAAADALLRWCGVADTLFGGEALLMSGLLELEDPPPPASAPAQALPSAHTILQALEALGVAAACPGNGARAAAPPRGAAHLHRMHNLKALLRVVAALGRMAAAGRAPLALPAGHGGHLLLVLLRLQLDPEVRAAALPALLEAAGAVMAAFAEPEWARVCGEVGARIAEPMGPSHRSAMLLLHEMPGEGARRWQLQQAAAAALLRRLLGKDSGGGGGAQAGAASPEVLLELLAPQGEGRRGHALSELLGAGARGSADYWGVLSVMDAADVLLWAEVEQGNGLEREGVDLRVWFVRWVEGLVPLLGANMRWHFVKARLTELSKRTYARAAPLPSDRGRSGGERQARDGGGRDV